MVEDSWVLDSFVYIRGPRWWGGGPSYHYRPLVPLDEDDETVHFGSGIAPYTDWVSFGSDLVPNVLTGRQGGLFLLNPPTVSV